MKKATSNQKRLPWSTPELRRIDAGSAEAAGNNGVDDAGAAPNHKS